MMVVIEKKVSDTFDFERISYLLLFIITDVIVGIMLRFSLELVGWS